MSTLCFFKALLLNLLFYCHLYFATKCYRLWNHFIGASFSLSLSHVNRILHEDILHHTLQVWPHKKGVKISVLVPVQRVSEELYSIYVHIQNCALRDPDPTCRQDPAHQGQTSSPTLVGHCLGTGRVETTEPQAVVPPQKYPQAKYWWLSEQEQTQSKMSIAPALKLSLYPVHHCSLGWGLMQRGQRMVGGDGSSTLSSLGPAAAHSSWISLLSFSQKWRFL